jgi:hypothetical protein
VLPPAASAVAAAPSQAPPSSAAAQLTPEERRKPVALDEAGRRTAGAYLAALGRGRKATLAKDFATAEAELSAGLELVSGDPRALGERGYARLLAGKLDDADVDLAAAEGKAPSTSLLLQIVHNRMLVARQRGDERAARGFEAQKKRLKAARQIEPGIDCTTDEHSSSLVPERPKTLAQAWKVMAAAHAKASSETVESIALGEGGEAFALPQSDAALWQQITGGPPRDGAWALTTSTSYAGSLSGHALFSKAGQLYLFPSLYTSLVFRCGQDGGGTVSVGGGGLEPWHIRFEQEQLVVGLLCEAQGNSLAPCGEEGGEPVRSFCSLASSSVKLTVLDAKTFEGLLQVDVAAQPSGNEGMGSSPRLLDVEWQPEHLVMNACGARKRVAYAPSGADDAP